ncbi:L-azetidine-2-carboxylic acid acetyltransferase [Smittium culicis]|uniref:L-azetidine-2-carboxylic acid acetyltransferase n=1 Tax=Smittium culicis TaxID=133412 RepID=A0A1R1WYM4_9FUNG|nr:L-azetidine-2-carboxylic acid acetyltransferase [Smittium culicis]OMJ07486.1 L-azetidine-2-carboxylic acid acetyltransferase [Smittium culicis]OMJ07674.1 L-azetidine-2-carboxylic acid acetyltransferase [Smittium culicis]OMJ22065.1 L-azetidine-2-carboxylic acid acetyltransferase [Smittium culicis]
MSSPYGKASIKPHHPTAQLISSLPVKGALKDGTSYRILGITLSESADLNKDSFIKVSSKPNLLAHCSSLLDEVIRDGDTYPFDDEMGLSGYKDYFLSHNAFILINTEEDNNSFLEADFDDMHFWKTRALGMFYIKPNFPGRCSHICNGGFIVSKDARGKSIGYALGQAYLDLAPKCGFKASMFNLVFDSNTPSVRLWEKLGFTQIGKIPKAGNLSNSPDKLVDAIIFYKEF